MAELTHTLSQNFVSGVWNTRQRLLIYNSSPVTMHYFEFKSNFITQIFGPLSCQPYIVHFMKNYMHWSHLTVLCVGPLTKHKAIVVTYVDPYFTLHSARSIQ